MLNKSYKILSFLESLGQLTKRIIQVFQEDGFLAMCRRVRSWSLVRFHKIVVDPLMLRSESKSVSKITQIDELLITSDNRAEAVEYEATPYLVLKSLQWSIPGNLSEWSFVDIGSGRGRVVIMAASLPYKRVIGVEFSEELHSDALGNLARLPKHKCLANDVIFVRADATEFDPPQGNCIFFLFNPFGASVMRKFLQNVIESYRKTPRDIVFVYYNPKQVHVFSEFQGIKSRAAPFFLRLVLSTMAPYDMKMFALEKMPETTR